MEFINLFIDALQKIAKETNKRVAQGKVAYSENLEKGIWYQCEYYRMLALWGKQENGRLKEFDPISFALEKGVAPSFTMEQIEEGLSFLDCSTVIMFSAYKALFGVLGEKFDQLFGYASPFAFRIEGEAPSPLTKLLSKHVIANEKQVQRGDICYFSNIHEYVAKHPVGESRGDHVVSLGGEPQLFIGFGLNDCGIDKTAIERELWECYNRPPVDQGYCDESTWNHLYSYYYKGDIKKGKALVESFRNHTISWEEFQKKRCRAQILGHPTSGKMGLWVYRFELDRVEKLIASDTKNLLDLFDSFPS